MRERETASATEAVDWPVFSLRYTFNPESMAGREEFLPDELVVRERNQDEPRTRWLAAKRGSYVSIEDVR